MRGRKPSIVSIVWDFEKVGIKMIHLLFQSVGLKSISARPEAMYLLCEILEMCGVQNDRYIITKI